MRILLILLTVLVTSCSHDFEHIQDFEWQFQYSTDVGHFKYLKTIPRQLGNQKCIYPVRRYQAIKIFKGDLKQGDTIDLFGDVDSYPNMEGERILFIRKPSLSETAATEECITSMYEEYKAIHNWCCKVSIDSSSGRKSVAFYQMVNSEERGPDILVDIDVVYKVFSKCQMHEQP